MGYIGVEDISMLRQRRFMALENLLPAKITRLMTKLSGKYDHYREVLKITFF